MEQKEYLLNKLSTLIYPSTIPPKDFDEKLLIEKYKQWDKVNNKQWNPFDSQIINLLDELIRKEVKDIVTESLHQSIVPSLQRTWKAIPSGKMMMHTLISMDIHAYAKFPSEVIEAFMDIPDKTKKKQLLDLHAQFKDLDWFWNQGLCFFQNDTDKKYYIRSYNDFNYCRVIDS